MELTSFTPGSVRRFPATKGTETTRETTDANGVTVNIVNEGTAATPAFFKTTFFIGYTHDHDGLTADNSLHIDVVALENEAPATYRDVEDQAAQQLPQILRDLADAVEADLRRAATEAAQGQDAPQP